MRYDLHIHTKYSRPCGAVEPKAVLKVARKKKLDGIAITDHHTLKGAREVNRLNRDRDFKVIKGIEIKTQFGDVLLYHVQEEIKTRDLFEVLDRARQQGCMVVIPHPFRGKPILPGTGFRYPIEKIKNRIQGIEAMNGRNLFWMNQLANRKATQLGCTKTAGSDAHYGFEIGRCFTEFEGEFGEAAKNKKMELHGTILFGLAGICKRLGEKILKE